MEPHRPRCAMADHRSAGSAVLHRAASSQIDAPLNSETPPGHV